jgi:hypothetical protein
VRHSSFKWIVTGRLISKNRIFGYAGPRMMETIQSLNHAFRGTYPAYQERSRIGPLSFLGGIIDPYMRRGGFKWLRNAISNPRELLDGVHVQSIVIVQAPDLLPDGSCDMCDSCPDMTFYKGELVRSCRWDEYRKYDTLLHVTWKQDEQGEGKEPEIHAPGDEDKPRPRPQA